MKLSMIVILQNSIDTGMQVQQELVWAIRHHLYFQPQEETNPLAHLPSSLNFIIHQQSKPSPYLHTAIRLLCMVLMLQKCLCDRQPIRKSSPRPC